MECVGASIKIMVEIVAFSAECISGITRQISNSYFCIVIKTLLERIINRLNLYHETKKNFSGFGDECRSFFLSNDTGKD